MKGIKTAAELDARLADILTVLHQAYEMFNEWEESVSGRDARRNVKWQDMPADLSSTDGQFYDENLDTVVMLSDGFGALEDDLAGLISDKMLVDLEMRSKGQ